MNIFICEKEMEALTEHLSLTDNKFWSVSKWLPPTRFKQISPDDVMIWKCFQHHWPLMREIHHIPVGSPFKGPIMQSFVALCAGLHSNFLGHLSNPTSGCEDPTVPHPGLAVQNTEDMKSESVALLLLSCSDVTMNKLLDKPWSWLWFETP